MGGEGVRFLVLEAMDGLANSMQLHSVMQVARVTGAPGEDARFIPWTACYGRNAGGPLALQTGKLTLQLSILASAVRFISGENK